MKRTTSIIIGTLSFFMMAMFAGIYYSWLQGDWKNSELNFSNELAEVNVSGIRVLRILRTDENQNGFVDGVVCVDSLLAGAQNLLYYSKDLSKYMKKTIAGDTLTIDLNFSKDVLPKELSHKKIFFPRNLYFRVAADSLTIISSTVDGLALRVSGLKRDTMSFSFQDHMLVDSCSFHSVTFSGSKYSRANLRINRSNISNLYLDIDALNWEVDSCSIGTEYISGSENNGNGHFWSQGECRKMVWLPKSEGAELSVILKGKEALLFE
jgi:hypothetical protein